MDISAQGERSVPPDRTDGTSRPITPAIKIGWWAIVLAAIAVVSWTALPVIGVLVFGEQNSGAFMVAAMVLAVAAAVFNVLSVSVWKQRSVLNIVAVILTVPSAVIALAEAVSILLGSE